MSLRYKCHSHPFSDHQTADLYIISIASIYKNIVPKIFSIEYIHKCSTIGKSNVFHKHCNTFNHLGTILLSNYIEVFCGMLESFSCI